MTAGLHVTTDTGPAPEVVPTVQGGSLSLHDGLQIHSSQVSGQGFTSLTISPPMSRCLLHWPPPFPSAFHVPCYSRLTHSSPAQKHLAPALPASGYSSYSVSSSRALPWVPELDPPSPLPPPCPPPSCTGFSSSVAHSAWQTLHLFQPDLAPLSHSVLPLDFLFPVLHQQRKLRKGTFLLLEPVFLSISTHCNSITITLAAHWQWLLIPTFSWELLGAFDAIFKPN